MSKRDTPWMKGNKHGAKDEHLSSFLHIKCLPEEKGKWVKAAQDNGTKLSNFVRDTLNKASE